MMLAVGALYTPKAPGPAPLMVPVERRGSPIAYIFLGWSLAAAIGLPLITFVASRYGWRAAYGGIGVIGFFRFLLLTWRLPPPFVGAPLGLKTWAHVGRTPAIPLLLPISTFPLPGRLCSFPFC